MASSFLQYRDSGPKQDAVASRSLAGAQMGLDTIPTQLFPNPGAQLKCHYPRAAMPRIDNRLARKPVGLQVVNHWVQNDRTKTGGSADFRLRT